MNQHITPEAHSDLVGGSTASRRIGCPRSYALEQLVPKDDRGSVFAQEGTALHEICAIVLEKEVEPTALLPFTFTSSKDGGWSFTVTQDLWDDKGETALAAFDKFVAETEERLGAEFTYIVETSVQFPGIPGAFGTSDVIGRCGNEIFVLDWKFGRGIVPATENKQLMFYAAGALNTARDFFEGMDLNHETPVTMVIIQPALSKGIDVWQTNLLRLRHFEVELQNTIRVIEEQGENAPIQDGPWCHFARCKVICPLHLGAAKMLATKFGELQKRLKPTGMTVDEAGDPVGVCNVCGSSWKDYEDPPCSCHNANDWPQRYADLMDLVDMVESFASEVRERVHHAAEQGMEIPGWALEMKRPGPRRWNCEDRDVISFMEGEGFDLDQIAPRKVLTLPQAEKILKKAEVEIPDDYITRPDPSGTKLVRATEATDPVEALPNKAATLAEKLMRL